MLYRKLKTGEELSLLGFGAMRLPTKKPGTEDIDGTSATELINYALAHGVNYFDTAWPYHDGLSESFLGRALVSRYARDTFYLATKLPVWEIESLTHADELFAKQLQKLQTDYLDFYLMHALDGARLDRMHKLGLFDWAAAKQKLGTIRRIGFSFHGTLDDLARIITAYKWDFAQIQLNYLDWDLQNAGCAYDQLADAGIPVIVMEPLRGGTLARLTPDAAAILRTALPDRSIASWGLRFAAELPNVVCVLSGMSTIHQVTDNVSTFTIPEAALALSNDEKDALTQATELFASASGTIGCTDCRYCTPCPSGVDIPRVFGIHNQYKQTENAYAYKMNLLSVPTDAQAESCTNCDDCLEKCPQQLDIPTLLEDIALTNTEIASVDEARAARAERIAQRSS